MKRILFAVVILLGVAIVLTARSCRSKVQPRRDQLVLGEPVRRATRLAADETGAPRLSWMLEPGVGNRRVAGIVLYSQAPVGGVEVTLHSARLEAAGLAPPRDTTTSDGRFDLGPQPADAYIVLARESSMRWQTRRVDLSDPSDPQPDELVIELQDCPGKISGRVYDAGGGTVAGASIEQTYQMPDGTYVTVNGVESDSEGRYEFCSRGGWEVVVSADGYGAVRLNNQAQDHDVHLVPEASASGVAIDSAGVPVADALIIFEPDADGRAPLRRTVATDHSGHFQIDGLTAGRYAVSATHRQYYSDYRVATFQARVGESLDGIVVPMRACPRHLAGRVLSGTSPIVGANIQIGTSTSITQEDGTFVVRCMESDALPVSVAGYELVEPHRIPEGDISYDNLVVVVRAGGTVRGRVAVDGVGLGGARVIVGRDTRLDSTGEQRTETNADGTFEVRGIPPGDHWLVALDSRSARRSPPTRVSVGEGQSIEGVSLALPKWGTIEGTVVFVDGSPVQNVAVRPAGSEPGVAPVEVDGEGRFVIEGVRPGKYLLRVWAPEMQPATEWPSVEVSDDAGTSRATIVVRRRERRRVSGRVAYDDGEPAAYAAVEAYEDNTVADLYGEFELEFNDVAGANRPIRVISEDGGVWKGFLAPGDNTISIVLPRAGSIEGLALGDAEGWRVSAGPKRRGYVSAVRGGRFFIDGVPPGRYELFAYPPTVSALSVGQELGLGSVTVTAAASAYVTVEIGEQVVGRGRLEGYVAAFPSGEALGGTTCSLGDSPAAESRVSDETGRFAFEVVRAGPITVSCRAGHPGGGGALVGRRTVNIAPGATAEVKVPVVAIAEGAQEGRLGARLVRSSLDGVEAKAFSAVRPDGAAARAGIEAGDILVEVAGASALGPYADVAAAYLMTRSPPHKLIVSRAGLTQEVSVE